MSRKIIATLLAAFVLCALAVMCVGAETADPSAAAAEGRDQPIALVIGMGIGVVFFGLICIVLLSMIMSAIVRAVEKKLPEKAPEAASPQTAPAASASPELSPEKRREVIAAVSAVIAEELGTDVSAIRVTSFKKV